MCRPHARYVSDPLVSNVLVTHVTRHHSHDYAIHPLIASLGAAFPFPWVQHSTPFKKHFIVQHNFCSHTYTDLLATCAKLPENPLLYHLSRRFLITLTSRQLDASYTLRTSI